METVATQKNRRRRIGLLALLAGVIALGVTLMPMTAGAVHSGPFELDGNALEDSNSAPPDDWGTLFPTDSSSTDLGNSFVTDRGETGPDPDDGYGSGQTKDTADVPNWSAVTGAISPEKDDILHAYAATYVSGSGEESDQLLYFGQDRAPKENGSTSMGFWFFQDKVAPDGAGGFNGKHVDGDLLITSDMTNGGSVSIVNIFRWQDDLDIEGDEGLVPEASLPNAECGSAPGDSLACAIANESGPIDVPWGYPADEVPQNIFFEGGINLSELFPGQAIPCFSSFLANTRTSPSETADLKDFVTGTIDTCGTITIYKSATPKSAQTFSFSTTGDDLSGFELADSPAGEDATDTKVFTGLEPGDYSVSEDLSQSLDWVNTDLTCTWGPGSSVDESGDETGRTASIQLGLAGNVDCTYVNERKPRVKLVKDLDPANDPGRFDLTLNGTTFDNGGQGFGHGGATDFVTVQAGAVTIAESAHAGTAADKYASSVSCDSGKVVDASGTSHGFTVANGESVTCTFTNHRKRGTLIVEKVVVNDDGGLKEAGDFSFRVNGENAVTFEADGQNELIVDAGAYAVTEPPVDGYTTSYSDHCANVVVPDGGSATCTITNNDEPAELIVRKVVVNDDGGLKEADDFSFRVNDGSAVQFEADAENELTVPAGTYNVAEPAMDGYTTTYAGCSNIVLANGGSATCTITNNDEPAELIVRKVVVNDDGGLKEAEDFSFRVNDGSAVQFEADAENELTVPAGTYNVAEPAMDGYTTTYAGCSNIVLANGGSATCTITNDDSPATLNVIKHVVNDDGGKMVAADFNITVTGTQASPSSFAGVEAPGTQVGIGAGPYDVTETEAAGYEATYSPDCSGSIANGQTKTCTITNDDQPATLIVKKVVVNDDGGTKTAGDFSFSVNGDDPESFDADGENDLTVDAGAYEVTEPVVDGYTTTYNNCSDLELANGGTATCTITNDDQPATLIVKKVVVNDDGGTKTAGDFSFSVNGAAPVSFETDGQNHLTVPAGTYSVTELAVDGYRTSYEGCSEVVIPNGGKATCTITNDDDIPPPPPAPQIDLSVTKVDAPDPAKLNGQIVYTMLVRNAGPSTATGVTLADPLPAGTSFVSVSTTQGTCSFSGGLVQCSLGTIPAGGSVSVTLVVKATRAGVLTNEVTVVGQEPESNTANNRATAPTLVLTPLLPPKPKPACSTLTVGPKSLRVGKRSTIAATVKNRGKAVKGAKVRVRGAGIAKSARTNARGKARITVRPSRPGIVVVSVPQKLVCGSKRIGVVGVFEPPVTG
jgi:uncharacterized repeat protein (TIGR01451 family)